MKTYYDEAPFERDSDGIGFVNQEEKDGRYRAKCQCGNDTFRVVYGEYYCGGICTQCENESELYSG